jgi:hypothetical protein
LNALPWTTAAPHSINLTQTMPDHSDVRKFATEPRKIIKGPSGGPASQ